MWFEITVVTLLVILIGVIFNYTKKQKDFSDKVGDLNTNFKNRKFELVQSEHQFKTFFNKMEVPACVFNLESMRFVQVNDKLADILEYSKSYLVKADLEDLLVKEDVESSRETAEMNKGGVNKGEHENTYITKSGKHIKLNWIFSDPDVLGNTFCIALPV